MKSIKLYKHHPYHILPNTSVPYILSVSLFLFVLGLLFFFHSFLPCRTGNISVLIIGLAFTIKNILVWSQDILEESKNKHIHNKEIEEQFIFGALLFIISETMLFFGFFWAFFHSSLNPSIFMGGVFPPIGIEPLNPAHWPLINTLTLLLSGVFVNGFYYTLKSISPLSSSFIIRNLKKNGETMATSDSTKNEISKPNLKRKLANRFGVYKRNFIVHWGVAGENFKVLFPTTIIGSLLKSTSLLLTKFNKMDKYLILTISLGLIFMVFQMHEYINHASFEIADGIYGSVFYMLTGLHGCHVLVGVAFLIYVYIQLRSGYYTERLEPHVGITFSVLYFHYVDIVWLFLYIFVYLWGY